MTTTKEEQAILKNLQIIRVTDYNRYSELIKAFSLFLEAEIERSKPKAEEKIIFFRESKAR